MKPVIDISGPMGNAFCLLGLASRYAKDLNKDAKKIKEEMTSGDYENLLFVFEREFGDYVTIYRGDY